MEYLIPRYRRRLQSLKHAVCESDAVFWFKLGVLEQLRNYICDELKREDWDTSILDTPYVVRLIKRRKLC